jgi:hypothetical protein
MKIQEEISQAKRSEARPSGKRRAVVEMSLIKTVIAGSLP